MAEDLVLEGELTKKEAEKAVYGTFNYWTEYDPVQEEIDRKAAIQAQKDALRDEVKDEVKAEMIAEAKAEEEAKKKAIIDAVRNEYKEVVGKNPFAGWSLEQLKEKILAHKAENKEEPETK